MSDLILAASRCQTGRFAASDLIFSFPKRKARCGPGSCAARRLVTKNYRLSTVPAVDVTGSRNLNNWNFLAMAKYSETLTEHVMAPRSCGVPDDPDLTGHAGTPGRGPFMVLFLKLERDGIVGAKYQTYGCGPTIASGSMLTEMIIGRTIAECRDLTVEDLIAALDGVPPDKLHCPALAIAALRDALSKWAEEDRRE